PHPRFALLFSFQQRREIIWYVFKSWFLLKNELVQIFRRSVVCFRLIVLTHDFLLVIVQLIIFFLSWFLLLVIFNHNILALITFTNFRLFLIITLSLLLIYTLSCSSSTIYAPFIPFSS